MHEGKVTYPDKLDKTKEIVEDYLICSRCFQTVLITADIRKMLDEIKDNGKPKRKVTRATHVTATGTIPIATI